MVGLPRGERFLVTDYDIPVYAKVMLVMWVGFAVTLLGIALTAASSARSILPMLVMGVGLTLMVSVVVWWDVQERRWWSHRKEEREATKDAEQTRVHEAGP